MIRKDLCGEAIRLCKMLLKNQFTNQPSAYALFALMCFHSARLDSKVNQKNEIIDLKNQDRKKWYKPLIFLGNEAMYKAVKTENFSVYHFEAAIAAEHLHAKNLESTNWEKILMWYKKLFEIQPSAFNLLNIAIVHLQLKNYDKSYQILQNIEPNDLEQRAYLYYGSFAEYFSLKGENKRALESLETALNLVRNEAERKFLMKKREGILKLFSEN